MILTLNTVLKIIQMNRSICEGQADVEKENDYCVFIMLSIQSPYCVNFVRE
jgi:hypothetical protein